MDLHTLEEQGLVCMSLPEQIFLGPPDPGLHCRFLIFTQSSLHSDHSDQADQCGGSTKQSTKKHKCEVG